jgi:hypothetical protein
MDVHGAQPNGHENWVRRNRWKLSFALAAALGGILWRSGRQARIHVERVSERWLAEQAFESGQRPRE